MSEKDSYKRLILVDQRAYVRELNEYNLDKKMTERHLIYFFNKVNPRGYVNALDLEFIVKALRKAGAMEIKKEPVICFQRFENGTGGKYIEYPLRFDVKYIGPVNFKKFHELIYN